MRRVRREARHVAVVLVWAMLTMGGTVVPHGEDCHDACGAAAAHDHNAHRVGAKAAAAKASPDHCLVCHWARSFRPRSEARVVTAPPVDHASIVRTDPLLPSAGSRVAQPPLRSPPLSSRSA